MLKKISLVLLSIVYALIFGEIFVRLFAPTALMPRYVTGALYGIRTNIPNAQFWQTTPETQAQIRTNSQGVRADKEYSYEKPTDRCRIVVLGDSFFVGYEVNLEDSFTDLLEQRLNKAGYPCDVINLAVSGFGTAEMLLKLQNEGLKYHPDIVLFQWHYTDLDDNVRSALFKLNKNNELSTLNSTYLPAIKVSDWLGQFSLYLWVIENSQLYSAIRENVASRIKGLLVNAQKKTNEPETAEGDTIKTVSKYSDRLSLALLQEARRVTEKHDAHFCVIEIPRNWSRVKFESVLPVGLTAELREELRLFESLEVFRGAADPERKLFFEKGHGHLTPEGNRLLTDFFFSQLLKTGWLPSH